MEVQHGHVFRTGLPVSYCFLFTCFKWWLLFVGVFRSCFCLFTISLISFFARFPRSPHFFSFWILDVEQTHPQFPQYRLEPHWYDRFSQGWNRTKLQSKQRRPGRKGIGKNPQGLRFSKMFFGELCITSVRISLHILFVIYQCPFWHCYRDSAKEFGSN